MIGVVRIAHAGVLPVIVFLAYATVSVLFGLLVPGYLAWLWRGRRHTPAATPPTYAGTPPVDVLVPVHDERALIERKVHNLIALAYPAEQLHVFVVDGASRDATADVAEGAVAGDRRFTILRVGAANKTAQLNAGLARCAAPWVMVTDADAWLPADTLAALVREGEADPRVAVVGAGVVPDRAHALEGLHWHLSNLLRRRESERGSASLVAAPCYLFRRSLIDRFPDDVVSDDVHVALVATAAGQHVRLAPVTVTELRSPIGIRELFRHKLRKTDAYLREVLRFLPTVGRMSSPGREIFLWRTVHLTVLPVLVTAAALGGALALAYTGVPLALRLGLLAVAAVLFLASWWGLGRFGSPLLLLAHGCLLNVVMLVALVSHPFSRQVASFRKVGRSGIDEP